MVTESWILEVRKLLAEIPIRPIATEGERHAALVPLFVENGQLWILLQRSSLNEAARGGAVFAQAPLTGDDPWQSAEEAAAEVGTDTSTVLKLGQLDDVETIQGEILTPCVGAVPAPATDSPATADLVRLPVVAARSPQLIEERQVAVGDHEAWFRIAHVGPAKLAGPEVDIVEDLLDRLFQG